MIVILLGLQTLQEALGVSWKVRQPIKESLPGQTLQERRAGPRPKQERAVTEPGPPQVPVQRQKTSQVGALCCRLLATHEWQREKLQLFIEMVSWLQVESVLFVFTTLQGSDEALMKSQTTCCFHYNFNVCFQFYQFHAVFQSCAVLSILYKTEEEAWKRTVLLQHHQN